MIERIYLTGFMTSGKSTLGRILANCIGWNFFDLDVEICVDEKKTVTEIFDTNGENYFRNIESLKLRNLSAHKNVVISLGGGTLISDENVKFIKENGHLIYLRVSPEVIYTRIKKKTDRPLFKELVIAENPKEVFLNKINNMLSEREPYYQQANLIFDVDNSPIGQTVDRFVKIINRVILEKNKN
ncbi:MAG: shikimate kinase [Ignavibacteriae bacterium]|nr:shikimate kinase [Ignavibacteriota bacterium]